MTVMFVRCKVQDYAYWKQSFDKANPMRKEAGIRDTIVHYDLDNPNTVTVCNHFENPSTARAYVARFNSTEVQAIVKQGGAIDPIEIWLAEIDEQ